MAKNKELFNSFNYTDTTFRPFHAPPGQAEEPKEYQQKVHWNNPVQFPTGQFRPFHEITNSTNKKKDDVPAKTPEKTEENMNFQQGFQNLPEQNTSSSMLDILQKTVKQGNEQIENSNSIEELKSNSDEMFNSLQKQVTQGETTINPTGQQTTAPTFNYEENNTPNILKTPDEKVTQKDINNAKNSQDTSLPVFHHKEANVKSVGSATSKPTVNLKDNKGKVIDLSKDDPEQMSINPKTPPPPEMTDDQFDKWKDFAKDTLKKKYRQEDKIINDLNKYTKKSGKNSLGNYIKQHPEAKEYINKTPLQLKKERENEINAKAIELKNLPEDQFHNLNLKMLMDSYDEHQKNMTYQEWLKQYGIPEK